MRRIEIQPKLHRNNLNKICVDVLPATGLLTKSAAKIYVARLLTIKSNLFNPIFSYHPIGFGILGLTDKLSGGFTIQKTAIESIDLEFEKALNTFIDPFFLKKGIYVIFLHDFSEKSACLLFRALEERLKHSGNVTAIIKNSSVFEVKVILDTKHSIRFRDSRLLLDYKVQDFFDNGLSTLTYNPISELKKYEEWAKVATTQISPLKVGNRDSLNNPLLGNMFEYLLVLCDGFKTIENLLAVHFKFNLKDRIIHSLSLSSITFYIFRYLYNKDLLFTMFPDSEDFTFLGVNIESAIRSAYFGGESQVYLPYLKSGFSYDMNRQFAFILKEKPLPTRLKAVWSISEGSIKPLTNDCFGFVLVAVNVSETIVKPRIPFRVELQFAERTIYPTGCWVGWISVLEMIEAQKRPGYEFKVLMFVEYESQTAIFKEYITKLNHLRDGVPKTNAIHYLAKSLGNLLYGRFGAGRNRYTYKLLNKRNIGLLSTWSKSLYLDKSRVSSWIRGYSAPQVAAYVTAWSRVLMFDVFEKCDQMGIKVAYSDCDSIFVDKPLPNEYLSETELGKFKKVDEFIRGYFPVHKMYLYTTPDGKQVFKRRGIGEEFARLDEKTIQLEFHKTLFFNTQAELKFSDFPLIRRSFREQTVETVFRSSKYDLTVLPEREKVHEILVGTDGTYSLWTTTKPRRVESEFALRIFNKSRSSDSNTIYVDDTKDNFGTYSIRYYLLECYPNPAPKAK